MNNRKSGLVVNVEVSAARKCLVLLNAQRSQNKQRRRGGSNQWCKIWALLILNDTLL